MKKTVHFFVAALFLSAGALKAQTDFKIKGAEAAPKISSRVATNGFKTEALWDIQANYNITAATGGNVGMAGVIFVNNQYWVSEWASDTVVRFSATGTLVDKFVIAGLSGIRSFTTDGTIVYASNNTNQIYRINPTTRQLSNPSTIAAGSSFPVRFCTYDITLNSGGGGFWVGNFNTDLQSLSMSGSLLSTISAATFNVGGAYGAAMSQSQALGSYIWLYAQQGANNCELVQLQMPSGTPTGVTRDVYTDISGPNSLSSGLAGGVFVTDAIVAGKRSIVTVTQGTPNNVLAVHELSNTPVGIPENSKGLVGVYPNPVRELLTISWDGKVVNTTYELLDLTGKIVKNGDLAGSETKLNVSEMPVGIYMLRIMQSGKMLAAQKIQKLQ